MIKIMFSALFWGVILILFGLSMIIKAFFGISIPVARITFALLFIYVGVKLLTAHGSCTVTNTKNIVFSKEAAKGHEHCKKYNIIFGQGNIDLTTLPTTEQSAIEVNVIFGNGTLVLNASQPTAVKVNTAFGSTQLPDETAITFGQYTYKNDLSGAQPQVTVDTNVVFGNLHVINRNESFK